MEAEFRRIKGVIATAAGYAGGHTKNPTYESVCAHGTAHAETVLVAFDPTIVSYDELLRVFWQSHDPTAGRSPGSQYRSVIFYHTPEQKKVAFESKARLEKSAANHRPVATEIVSAGPFWRAEDYHQQFEEKRGYAACPIR